MLKQITIHNGIKHHGRTFNFEKGFTTITGANESGKSLILEFIRYALFGTKALRGNITDYEGLRVELEFEVKDVEFDLIRSKSTAELKQGVQVLATGTTAVNAEIETLLGYNLTIFDMANCAMQGKVTELGKMTPTQRKEAVDKTIGLSALDDIIKLLKEERKTFNDKIEVLSEHMYCPEQPTKPKGYVEDTAPLWKTHEEKTKLNGQLEMVGLVSEPKWELEIAHEAWADYYEKQSKLASEKRDSENFLTNERKPTVALEEILRLEEQWELYHKCKHLPVKPKGSIYEYDKIITQWKALEDFELKTRYHPKPIYTLGELLQMEADWELYIEVEEAKRQVKAALNVQCPNCEQEFMVGVSQETEDLSLLETETPKLTVREIDQMKNSIAIWADLAGIDLTKPEISLEIATANQKDLLLWRGFSGKIVAQPEVSEKTLAVETEYHKQATTYTAKRKRLSEIEVDAELELKTNKFNRYNTQLKDFNLFTKLDGELKKLPTYDTLALAVACESYASKQKEYLTHYERFKKDSQTVADYKEEREERSNAVTGLQNLKRDVKQYLIPSLSKIASSVAEQMSDGRFTSIEIDADFNITADGTKINLFSGSAQAIINLAVRIALGQALTNKVFSVFMGDELDESMEEKRAADVAASLEGLNKVFKQIIVVSHKNITADHTIQI